VSHRLESKKKKKKKKKNTQPTRLYTLVDSREQKKNKKTVHDLRKLGVIPVKDQFISMCYFLLLTRGVSLSTYLGVVPAKGKEPLSGEGGSFFYILVARPRLE